MALYLSPLASHINSRPAQFLHGKSAPLIFSRHSQFVCWQQISGFLQQFFWCFIDDYSKFSLLTTHPTLHHHYYYQDCWQLLHSPSASLLSNIIHILLLTFRIRLRGKLQQGQKILEPKGTGYEPRLAMYSNVCTHSEPGFPAIKQIEHFQFSMAIMYVKCLVQHTLNDCYHHYYDDLKDE